MPLNATFCEVGYRCAKYADTFQLIETKKTDIARRRYKLWQNNTIAPTTNLKKKVFLHKKNYKDGAISLAQEI